MTCQFIDAHEAEVSPGSPDAVTVRLAGFELLRNGDFRIASTWTHPSPPPRRKAPLQDAQWGASGSKSPAGFIG